MRVRTRKISQSCTSPKKHGGNKEEKKMREFLKSTNQGVRKNRPAARKLRDGISNFLKDKS